MFFDRRADETVPLSSHHVPTENDLVAFISTIADSPSIFFALHMYANKAATFSENGPFPSILSVKYKRTQSLPDEGHISGDEINRPTITSEGDGLHYHLDNQNMNALYDMVEGA
jgi:hypothetical protein